MPRRVALLNLIWGQKAVTFSSRRTCAAAMRSCFGCDRRQYQADSVLFVWFLCGVIVLSMAILVCMFLKISIEARRINTYRLSLIIDRHSGLLRTIFSIISVAISGNDAKNSDRRGVRRTVSVRTI